MSNSSDTSSQTSTNNWRVYLLMTMATFFWAGAFIAGKFGIHDFSPLMLSFLRMALAALIMFPIMIFKDKNNWKLKKSEIKYVLTTGIIGMVFYHLLFFTALEYTTASKASMINALNPLLTAILASHFAGEKLNSKRIFFVITAFLGVVFILLNGQISTLLNLDFNRGDIYMIFGMTCWAVYSIFVRKYVPIMGPIKLTAYSFLVAAIILMPFAIVSAIQTGALSVGFRPYLAVLYMAIFPSVIGYTIQQFSIGKIGASKTSLFINLVPIISAVLAVMFLGESIYPYHIIGATLIIFSVIGFNRSPA